VSAERRFLEDALAAHEGNIQRTARAIGVTRGLLYRKLQKHGLSPR
jgi:sigma-54 dependent transcriptional regulator, acetoin dehydrogenase operon transcriptional activator AcoR